jgi:rhodanese-related sulfurtransferase
MPYNETMTKPSERRRSWKRILLQALCILGLSLVLGLGRNALSSRPLPLFQAFNPMSRDSLGIRHLDSLQTREAWERHFAIFLDARRSELFKEGHVPGAKSIPLDDFDTIYPQLSLSSDSAYIIYCEGKDCEYSDLLAQRLYALGYRKLAVFPGGWEEWTKGKHPIEKDST